MSKFLKAAAIVVFSGVFAASVFAEDMAETAIPTSDQSTVTTDKPADATTTPPAHHTKKHLHRKKHLRKQAHKPARDANGAAVQSQGKTDQNQPAAMDQVQGSADQTAPAGQ